MLLKSKKPLVNCTTWSMAALSLMMCHSLSSALTVEEVVVTAQKREQSANDVSVAISAFSGEDLAEVGVVDTRDLSNLIPGFSFADSGQNAPIYSLRGIGFNEKSQTASSTVGVYIDEVALPFPVMTKGANLDLERVEVLKGPQGTLYGRNTTGGAINYIAGKPTETFEAGISASYGRFETSDVEGFVSGPLGDKVGYRLAFRNIYAGEGWQKSLSRTPGTAYQEDLLDGDPAPITSNPVGELDTLGEKDKQAARLKLVFYPTDTLTVNTSLDYWRDQSEPQAAQPFLLQSQSPILPFDVLHPDVFSQPLVTSADNRWADWPVGQLPNALDSNGNEIPGTGKSYNDWNFNDTFIMGTLRLDKELNDVHSLTFLGSYADFDSEDSRLPSSGLAASNQDIIQNVNTEMYSLELRLAGDNGEDKNWLLGVFHSYDHVTEVDNALTETGSLIFNVGGLDVPALVTSLTGLDVNPVIINLLDNISSNLGEFPVVTMADTKGDQETEINAVFGNFEWQLSDDFKFTSGLRYTKETRDYTGCTADSLLSNRGVGLATLFQAVPALYNPNLSFADVIQLLTTGGVQSLNPGDCITVDSNTFVSQPVVDTLEESNVSGRLALDWTPTDELLFYLSYARGFKSGSFPILSASFSNQYEPATQEKLDAFEFGWKNSLLDGLMQFNGATFFYLYEDKQLLGSVADPIFGQLPKLENAPESEVYGIEMDIQYSPIDGLYLALAASYIKTEIKEYRGTNELGVVDVNSPDGQESFAGQPFNFSPEKELSLLINYVLPIGDSYEMTFGVDYSYTDDTSAILSGYIDNALVDPLTETGENRAIGFDASGNPVAVDSEDFHIDSYALVNARISFGSNDDVWKVMVWGRNITNETYANSIINPGDGISRYTGMPQTYGVTVSYNYF